MTKHSRNAGAQRIRKLLVDAIPDNEDIYIKSTAISEDNDSDKERTSTNELWQHLNFGETTLRSLAKKYFALSAACALFNWLDDKKGITFSPRSLNIRYEHPEGSIMIDHDTATNLELVRGARSGTVEGSLLGSFHRCSTSMGERMLKMNILQPFANRDSISMRLDAVEDLLSSSELGRKLFYALKESLKAPEKLTIDFDRLIYQIVTPIKTSSVADPTAIEAKLAEIIQLYAMLGTLSGVHRAVSGASCTLLQGVAPYLANERLSIISTHIKENIDADVLEGQGKVHINQRLSKIRAIQTNKDKLLDLARETYSENLSDGQALFSQLKGHYRMPLTLKKEVNGYCEKINQRIRDAEGEVFILSEKYLESMRGEIIEHVGALYKASEVLALVDLIVNLAKTADRSRRDYVRPNFSDRLAIKAGRHPILEKKIGRDKTHANDIYFGLGKSFQLITGPNMSGKTTYLKQAPLLLIMASIGSFIPAEYAMFPPIDRILTRLSNDDEPEANLSTFASEMKVSSFILSLASRRSLVIIDELGRGTSTEEGLGVAHAISEFLITKGAPTIFATHFVQLASTLSPYEAVVLLHLAVKRLTQEREDDEDDKYRSGNYDIECSHTVVDGVMKEKHYGLALIKKLPFPVDLWRDAVLMADRLEADVTDPSAITEGQGMTELERVAKRREIVNGTEEKLRNIQNQVRASEAHKLWEHLKSLQEEVLLKLQETYDGAEEGDTYSNKNLSVDEQD
ncbi:hypothetical protein FA10DRAFT_292380 [Acaromyces ingoldii]|uniref:DNA mismatch repair proteins mutS family domain-containing protein n=1 Tax=Acaromyces ingoldii TaxID=215250 RepID=A0A316YTZ1_9BASI|nr:hypothetical protein FA10DRAFT_292380 [Acaromyces ingoldii]PWN91493.1 hypothetical protein FA10DRAFT_292380 [Acaromyces ingoldii]